VAVAVSSWPLDFRADDHALLATARAGVWPLEPAHLSLPRDALFHLCARADAGAWLPRAVALVAHLVAALALLPRVARRLVGDAGPGRVAGLIALALPATLDPLLWPCASAYALLEALLLAVAWTHLAWLDEAAPRLRAASLVATGAALLTWELGVVAPLVPLALSWSRRRPLRDALPHALLALPWLGLKLALGSTATLAASAPLRVAGNVAFAPLLLLSPAPLERDLLVSPAGVALALVALGVLAWSARRAPPRVGLALAALAFAPLLPALAGPGPESRYLLP
jgi:hypothetical protein